MTTIRTFENHLPPKFWVTVCNKGTDIVKLILGNFIVFTTDGFLKQIVNGSIKEHLMGLTGLEVAETFPVMDKITGEMGVLVVVYSVNNITNDTIPHEAVHVADYFYEYTNQNTEYFSEGNENYAYLVGWSASKIFNVIKECKDGETE